MEPFSFVAGFVTLPTLALLLLLLVLTIEVAYDLGFVAALTAIVFVAAGLWMGWFTFAWIFTNWPEALMIAGAYILVGVFWCVVKWWLYLHDQFEYATQLIHSNPEYAKKIYGTPPQVSNHKQDIVRWMMWWPFSFVAWICSDFFRRVFDAIYRNIAVLLQRISDRMFAKLKFPD